MNSRTFQYSCISQPARARQILWWGHGWSALGGLRHCFRLDWGSLGGHCSLHFGQRHVWNVGQNPAFSGSMHHFLLVSWSNMARKTLDSPAYITNWMKNSIESKVPLQLGQWYKALVTNQRQRNSISQDLLGDPKSRALRWFLSKGRLHVVLEPKWPLHNLW